MAGFRVRLPSFRARTTQISRSRIVIQIQRSHKSVGLGKTSRLRGVIYYYRWVSRELIRSPLTPFSPVRILSARSLQ
jgi:hypothetical protein